ncbi:MAG: 2-hydroxyacid dehydrogenase [Candidatus Omnitrophica bacterium]|nr:2-hydroxyacid dehydrogenase [Candidatus Omnitrophota bacterium]
MKVAVFSAKPYDRQFLEAANAQHKHHLQFFEPHLSAETSALVAGFPAVCVFVHDRLDASVLQQLASGGTRLVALRCAGFNNVDLEQAEALGMIVTRVPAYSPYAVAEHAVGLILALNRKIHRAHARVREGNLALEGLLGADLHGQTVGVIGTGKIGAVFARIMHGFGCRLLAYDPIRNPECEALGARYTELGEVFAQSDIISLHCPLTPQTHHLINREALRQMKRGVILINTSRGAVIDTKAVVEALKSGKIGALGLDVYEEEADLFFEDLSNRVIQDDVFARLLTFPNVIITGHQAFFTRNAMEAIAQTTLANITAFERGQPSGNEVTASKVRKEGHREHTTTAHS